MIGIPLALLSANATEWFFHKYVLHGAGKNKKNFWSFHWHEHHRETRKHQGHDPNYHRTVFAWNSQGKEAAALVGAGLLVLPLFPIAPFFAATSIWSAWYYHHVHKKSHMDPEWAREHLPWHYDHHMGPNQDANWCVSFPWFDHIMGTRKPYVGTERERQDRERRQRKEAAKKTAPKSLVPKAA